MDTLLQDLRFGWRLLWRSPGFTIAAVLALALGIGATTSIFSVVDRVVLRPLPYPDPDRLAMVWEMNDGKGLAHERLSPVNFGDYRRLTQVFDDAAAWWYPQLNLTEPGHDPLRVNAIETSGNFFKVIGVNPVMGAGMPADPLYSRDFIIVISHRLWRDRFNSDPSIVGKAVALNSQAFTIVGVMPDGFNYPGETDVWQRLTWDMAQHSRAAHFMESLFRLKPGVAIDRANGELRALTTRLGAEFKATNGEWHARAVPLATEVVGAFRPALFALFGAALFLLLITCTNVASLLLARATVREREVAVRTAIGAGRGRLIRQFLTESLILAALGTALGVVVAVAAVRLLVRVTPVQMPRLTDSAGLGVDPRVLLFACGLAAVTAIAFGIVPALFMVRGDIQRPLKDARGADGGGARRQARSILVVAEVALAVVLLVGAALLARSFQRLVAEDPSFRPARTMTASVELPYSYTDWKKISLFYDQLLASLPAQPAISAAGATNFLPFDAAWRGPFGVPDHPRADTEEAQAQHQTVDENYFRMIGVPLMKGRLFDARDTMDAPGVIVVNEALARKEWPNEDPLGKVIVPRVRVIGPMGRLMFPENASFQIVGVVGDLKNTSLVRDAEPAIYFSFRQYPFRGLNVLVQGTGTPASLVYEIRNAVRRLDPNLPVANARSLDSLVATATDRPRALMLLMAVFAALALGLAALGIYSVMSFGVNQRRQELSVRMALGARPRDLLWLVVRHGMWLTVIGGAAGVFGAVLIGRTMSSLLYGVSASDITAFAVALGLSLATALIACWLPARRAAALNPLEGLRS
ncbi:MAG TPA: ABC transporter permease [Vicinamibacterales bacterium]